MAVGGNFGGIVVVITACNVIAFVVKDTAARDTSGGSLCKLLTTATMSDFAEQRPAKRPRTDTSTPASPRTERGHPSSWLRSGGV